MAIFKSTILISDPKNPNEIEEWARKSKDFLGVVVTDVSDFSYTTNEIYAYTFKTEKAANWFRLRWL